MALLRALLLTTLGVALAQDAAFECAMATYAQAYGAAKLPPGAAAQQLSDALNLPYLCQNASHAALAARALAPLAQALAAERALHSAAREGLARALSAPGALATFFVAVTGSDAAPGTQAQPFATLQRAAAAARAVPGRAGAGAVTILVRGGTYYMGLTGALVLGAADSNTSYAAFPGERVVLSGAMAFAPGSLAWAPSATGAPGTLVASLPGVPVDARARAWGARAGTAGPPPLVSSLFVNGTRQVRARYPNGNPQDGTGICFSATQRPGEGCSAYSTCALGQTGRQPAPSGMAVGPLGPKRGDSPTLGCAQCHECDSFKYTIYPPPPAHPVYNAPLPGVGWANSSVFSFWGSPFDRPAGVLLDAAHCSENSHHWLSVNYSNPTGAVVHMFHGGLWGGWQYAVDNVSTTYPSAQPAAAAAAAAEPSKAGLALWLRADTLAAAGVANGARVSAWEDVSSGQGLSARQAQAGKQPTFLATGGALGAGVPVVRFSGSSVLGSASGAFGPATTHFAVLRDTGSSTAYCSGVVSVAGGGLNSLCTRSAQEPGGAPADDDPRPAGARITAAALDWPGSPADPGHRDLTNKTIVLSAVYSAAGAQAYVGGCLELATQAGTGHAGTGFYVGSRNDEDGRYLVGDVAEVLVYNRALSAAEHGSVVAYLLQKYGLQAPRHCAPPPPPGAQLRINFGYGGYQEARGSGINPGQHFFLENVREELDAPGEWWYDGESAQLYYMPNATAEELGAATLALPLLNSVLVVNGSSSSSSVQDVGFAGFTITQTRTTFLEMYEVPSGGDWSVHRGGAVHVEGAENVTLAGLTLDQVGGNGVLFSNSVLDSTIADCEFVHSGDSAVVLLGSTNAVDGSAPTFPNRNAVLRNHMHEVGVYGKQTSCFAQQLSANSFVSDNVCYNGPRAGVNFNDNFYGGNVFANNLVFNAVRETGDHGPLNSWGRQPYLTINGVDDGFKDPLGRSILNKEDTNTNNMMINGYNGVWTFDHDDCSQFVTDEDNFMVFGGCKNYLGHHKRCNSNVILYPGIAGRSAGGRKCQTDDNGVFAEQFHENNVCATADGAYYSFSGCTTRNLATTVYVTRNNSLLADKGPSAWGGTCGAANFSDWQALGQDAGSTTGATPPVAQLIAMGAAKTLQRKRGQRG